MLAESEDIHTSGHHDPQGVKGLMTVALLTSLCHQFAGTQKGRFYKIVPSYVDPKAPPGASVVPEPTFAEWLQAGPFVLINTPNTVWAGIALVMYFAAPYDLSPSGAAAAAPLSVAFFISRFPLWLSCWFGCARPPTKLEPCRLASALPSASTGKTRSREHGLPQILHCGM